MSLQTENLNLRTKYASNSEFSEEVHKKGVALANLIKERAKEIAVELVLFNTATLSGSKDEDDLDSFDIIDPDQIIITKEKYND